MPTASSPRMIIADDHPLFRVALKNTLERLFSLPTVLEAEDFNSLDSLMQDHQDTVNLLLLDLHMPGCEGFSALVYVTAHFPTVPVIVVSAHQEAEIIRRAMDHGASGFLPKSASLEDMQSAIKTVLDGGLWKPQGILNQSIINHSEKNIADSLATLTQQQFRVASMVNQGLLNKQIAYELNITEATVKAHMTEIFRKLKVNSRTQVALAIGQLAVRPTQSVDDFRS